MKFSSKLYANEILKDIHNKNLILKEKEKNTVFMKKYGLSKDDIDNYVYQLTPDNFSERVENKDSKIKAKYLYIFQPIIQLADEYGFVSSIKLYIKICYLSDSKILIVSFHEDDM